MKLFNILFIAAILFGAVACSTEGMMDESSAIEQPTASTNNKDNAYLSLNVNSTDVTTKAGAETESTIAQTINSCTVILYNNSGILSINDNVTVEDDGTISNLYYTKVNSALKVMIIANSTVAFSGRVANMDEVNSMLQSDAALNADNLVKAGTATVDFSNFSGSTSTGATADNTLDVTITVSQLTACVRLVGFNVVKFNGKASDVVVKSVSLKNINTTELTDGTEDHSESLTSKSEAVNETIFSNGAPSKLSTTPTFFSFSNSSDDATAIEVVFSVGEKEYTKSYVINNGSIETGVLYNLTVNMTINNDVVDVDFVTYTCDWTEGNEINIDMTK